MSRWFMKTPAFPAWAESTEEGVERVVLALTGGGNTTLATRKAMANMAALRETKSLAIKHPRHKGQVYLFRIEAK